MTTLVVLIGLVVITGLVMVAAVHAQRIGLSAYAAIEFQLKTIHTLVNSDMTAARQAELDQVLVTLALLRKIATLDRVAGREPTEEDLAALDRTMERIGELRVLLADRLTQQLLVDQAGIPATIKAQRRGP